MGHMRPARPFCATRWHLQKLMLIVVMIKTRIKTQNFIKTVNISVLTVTAHRALNALKCEIQKLWLL